MHPKNPAEPKGHAHKRDREKERQQGESDPASLWQARVTGLVQLATEHVASIGGLMTRLNRDRF